MAYKLMRQNGIFLENQHVYVCDTRSEVQSIRTGPKGAPFGSIAKVTADGSVWMLRSNNVWVEQPKEASAEAIAAAQEAVEAAEEATAAADEALAAAQSVAETVHFTDFDTDKTYNMAWGTKSGHPVLRLTEVEE